MSTTISTVTMPGEDGYQKCVTTDLAKHLREAAIDCGKNGLVTMHQADVLAAVAEIERYYGGMLAWKRVAEQATQIAEEEIAKRKPNKPVPEL